MTTHNCLQTTGVQPLADYPFKAHVDYLLGTATASGYDQDLSEIHHRVNYNNCAAYPPLECIRKDKSDRVVNTYVNIIKQNPNAPIFSYHYLARDPKPEQENLIRKIEELSGVGYSDVRKVMKEVYNAAKDGSINNEMLNPRKAAKNKLFQKPPGDANTWDKKITGNLKTAAIIAGVAGGGILLFKALSFFD